MNALHTVALRFYFRCAETFQGDTLRDFMGNGWDFLFFHCRNKSKVLYCE
jgi:hypothetical protein